MKKLKIAFILISAAFIPFLIIFLLNFVRVSEVVCENQYGKCSEILSGELEKTKGTSILSARKNILKIISDSFLVKNYSLSYKLPAKYVVHLVERKPTFALESEISEKVAMVDDEGKVLSFSNGTILPKILVNEELPNPGESVTDEELFSLKLVSQIYSIFKVDKSVIDKQNLTVFFSDGNQAIFPSEGDKKILLGSLIIILNKIKDDNGDFNVILEGTGNIAVDLRYENPVIRKINF